MNPRHPLLPGNSTFQPSPLQLTGSDIDLQPSCWKRARGCLDLLRLNSAKSGSFANLAVHFRSGMPVFTVALRLQLGFVMAAAEIGRRAMK